MEVTTASIKLVATRSWSAAWSYATGSALRDVMGDALEVEVSTVLEYGAISGAP